MENVHYPSLFQSSDSAAESSQWAHLQLVKLQLGTAIVAAFTGAFIGASTPPLRTVLAIAAAVSLAVNLLVTGFIKGKRLEDTWFQCRSLAETAKSLTWRYCMGVPPFALTLPDRDVDALFNKHIAETEGSFKGISAYILPPAPNAKAISEEMRALRKLSLKERADRYLEGRLRDQLNWYSGKATLHRRVENTYFWIIVSIQGLALVLAICVASGWTFPMNMTGLFTTLAAALIAWTQVNKFAETRQAYNVASHELTKLESEWRHVTDQSTLDAKVKDVEQSVSREHTMWYAKKTGKTKRGR